PCSSGGVLCAARGGHLWRSRRRTFPPVFFARLDVRRSGLEDACGPGSVSGSSRFGAISRRRGQGRRGGLRGSRGVHTGKAMLSGHPGGGAEGAQFEHLAAHAVHHRWPRLWRGIPRPAHRAGLQAARRAQPLRQQGQQAELPRLGGGDRGVRVRLGGGMDDEANKRWQKLSERFPKAQVVWASHEALNPRRTKARTDQKRYCYKYQRGRCQDERKATQLAAH
ncbi:unnamed protein product, partial [Effrenium voratum]